MDNVCMWLPENALQLVEFNHIQSITAQFAASNEAGKIILAQQNGLTFDQANVELEIVSQTLEIIKLKNLVIPHYEDIQEDVHLSTIPNYILALESFLRILSICKISMSLLELAKDKQLKHLTACLAELHVLQPLHDILQRIEKIMDDKGLIHDHASAELLHIRQQHKRLNREVYGIFKKEVEKYKNLGYLAEGDESVRNGRLVLRVQAEHKRKVNGMIVDDSDSGKTFYIEPENTLHIYNTIVEMELLEKKEIQKILGKLTNLVSSYSEQLCSNHIQIIQIDVWLCKAKLAFELDAIKPELENKNALVLKDARHPLLILKYKAENKKVVPFSFYLDDETRILIISGPNAGGKSIVLKAVGLLQIMLSNGYLVPVATGSKFSIFHKVFVDIGDQQSLSDGLSTYSAKLKNMQKFMENADDHTLVLLDEFGSGTEPAIGGAIAEAILKDLHAKKCYGVFNTHYANLKSFAHHTKGLINGAMIFAEKELKPTYQLKVGRPGSSYALEIARTLNFPEPIIEYAKKKAGTNVVQLEEVISKLDTEKSALEFEVLTYKLKVEQLNKLIKAYEQMQKQYEIKRVKLKLETKKKEWEVEAHQSKSFDKLVKEIKQEQNLQKALQISKDQKTVQKRATDEFQKIHHELNQLENPNIIFEPKMGDPVKLIINGMIGVVTSIENNYYAVTTDQFTFKVMRKDIVSAVSPLDIRKTKHITSQLVGQNTQFNSTIDLRGLLPIEALRALENYLDQALLVNVHSLKIMHGKGTGVLRKAVGKALKAYPYIKHIHHPAPEEGGEGVTIVEFVK